MKEKREMKLSPPTPLTYDSINYGNGHRDLKCIFPTWYTLDFQ